MPQQISPEQNAEKQRQYRVGLAHRLDLILAELGDLRESIAVLAERQKQQQDRRRGAD